MARTCVHGPWLPLTQSTRTMANSTELIALYNNRTRMIYLYGSPVLIIVGTLGNCLTLAILGSNKRMRGQTSNVLLMFLAILDIIILNTGLMRFWIRFLKGVDIRAQSTAACKVHMFTVYFVIEWEAWVLVLLTSERLVAVLFPTKLKTVFSRKKALVYAAILGTVFATACAFILDCLKLDPKTDRCDVKDYCRNFIHIIWPYIDLFLASLLPFVIIIIFNIIIIAKIAYQARVTGSSDRVKMTSTTTVLITVSISFLILTLPVNVSLVLQGTVDQNDEVQVVYHDYIFNAVNIVYYMNNALNFFLYCVTSPRFRRQLLFLFGVRRRQIEPEHTSAN